MPLFHVFTVLPIGTPAGSTVIEVKAFDLDRGSALRYSIVPDHFSAKNPSGDSVVSTAAFDYRVSHQLYNLISFKFCI